MTLGRRRVPALAPWALLCTASVATAVVAVLQAWRLDPLPPPSPPPGVPMAPGAPESTGVPRAAVLAAVEAAPFDPEREPPDRRLHPTGTSEPREPEPEAAALRLLGTAVLPGTPGVALCAFGPEPPRLVRLHEEVGPYRLIAIRPGEADFVDDSGTPFTFTVPPGSGS